MNKTQPDLLKARASALASLSRRDHAEAELRQKLEHKGYPADTIAQVLDEMRGHGYLDDARFSASYARLRAARGYGPVKIRHELQKRGVSAALVKQAMAQLDIDFTDCCHQVQRRKFGSESPRDLKDKARRQRFLYQRGFDADCIRRAVPDPKRF